MRSHSFVVGMISLTMLVTVVMPTTAMAAMSTADVLVNTVKGVEGCLSFKIKGVCTWLKCGWGCSIKTSLRVEHYVPEVVVSTFHEPLRHPWGDYGRLVSTTVSSAGSAILSIPIDSAGTQTKSTDSAQFRDADAIGNPVAQLSTVLSGGWPTDIPGSFPVPTPIELAGFAGEMGSIAAQWAALPGQVAGASVAKMKEMADVPGKVASLGNKLQQLPNQISSVANGVKDLPGSITKSVSGTVVNGVNFTDVSIGNLADSAGLSNFDMGGVASAVKQVSQASSQINQIRSLGKITNMPSIGSLVNLVGLGVSDVSLFCPASSIPFGLHFNSHLDALSWRGVLPVEMLYPASWVPGMREIGSFPANTWGAVYPRDGNITQPNPVKASAVLAQRVGDIIDQRSQPHIYSPLIRPPGDFRFFNVGQVMENNDQVKWQRIYPSPTGRCTKFGENDSLSASSFGDNRTSAEESYAWNMWRRYECCKKRGVYLGSITW
jgi:integrating conjugative element protein (TIGR03756 family)